MNLLNSFGNSFSSRTRCSGSKLSRTQDKQSTQVESTDNQADNVVAAPQNLPQVASENLRQIARDAGQYNRLSAGDSLPISELIEQAKAHGYDSRETQDLLRGEDLESAEAVRVPPQGKLFGETFAYPSEQLEGESEARGATEASGDNVVSSAQNQSSPDSSSRKACSPSPDLGEQQPEPLDEGNDFLALDEPMALDGSNLHPEFIEGGDPLSAAEGIDRYRQKRHGENTSAERHGFTRTLQWADKRRYARGMEMDRQLLEGYENPTTALLSLRVERDVPNRATLLRELSDTLSPVLRGLRYRVSKYVDSFEWLTVFAGTRRFATPHLHILVWADGDVPRAAFERVVDTFIDKCNYAPSSGRGNSPEGGAIRIKGRNPTEPIPQTEDGGSAAATYVLTQLPHLEDVDSMDHDQLLFASTCRAAEGIHHFRKSSYTVWDDEPETEGIEDCSVDTTLSTPSIEEQASISIEAGEQEASATSIEAEGTPPLENVVSAEQKTSSPSIEDNTPSIEGDKEQGESRFSFSRFTLSA